MASLQVVPAANPAGPPFALSVDEEPILINNDATLRHQQDRIIQVLCGSEVRRPEIRHEPTSLQSLRTWRNRTVQHQDERHTFVKLIMLLEDMILTNPNLRWKNLEAAWNRLFAPSSMMHLVVNVQALKLPDGSFMGPQPDFYTSGGGQTLWTLATRIEHALRLHENSALVNADLTRPAKRRRVMEPSPAQQAATAVLIAYFAVLDQSTDVTQWTVEYQRRWSVLMAGWSRLEESVWLSAWNHVLQQRTADVATVKALLTAQIKDSTWLLWTRITGLEDDVAVALWGERLVNHANQSDDDEWWNVLQQAMTWWDPLSKRATEVANTVGFFGMTGAQATATDGEQLDNDITSLTEWDPSNVVASMNRLSIPAYAEMVHGLLALQRNLWEITLKLAARLENQHGTTQAAAWVLYQFLFEFFAKNGTLLDLPLGPREARKSWVNEFQWTAGRLGRQCFTEGFEILGQEAAGSLLQDICSYAVNHMKETQSWASTESAKKAVASRPSLDDQQRMSMDERVIQALAGKRPLIEAAAVSAHEEVVLAIEEEEEDEVQVLDVEESDAIVENSDGSVENEEHSVEEEDPEQVAVRSDSEDAMDAEAVEVASDDEEELEREGHSEEEHGVEQEVDSEEEHREQEEASDDGTSENAPSPLRPGGNEKDAIEVLDDSEEEEMQGEDEAFSHDDVHRGEEEEHHESDGHREESGEEEREESEGDEEQILHESDDGHEDAVVYEIDDEGDEDNAEAMAEEDGEEEEPAEEAVAEVSNQHDDILILDDGAEADVSEEAAEDIRPRVVPRAVRQELDGDENYYATAEESQDDEDIAQALSQDESNAPSRNDRFPPNQANEERHVRIEAPIQPVQPAPKLDDGYVPSDEKDHTEDEMPAPPVRSHHERDGYQGGESSLCHTEDDDEEISEAAEEEEENAHITSTTGNGVAAPRAQPALDSHSLSGMSAADERGPEEESSELEEANESDQVHFPVTHSIRTTVQPANASLEDYAAAAARQESSMPRKPRSRHSSDTTNRLSIGSPDRFSHDGSEDEAAAEHTEKPAGEPPSTGNSEHTDEHEGLDDHDDGGDEGTVMGAETDELDLDHTATGSDELVEKRSSLEGGSSQSQPIVVGSEEMPTSAGGSMPNETVNSNADTPPGKVLVHSDSGQQDADVEEKAELTIETVQEESKSGPDEEVPSPPVEGEGTTLQSTVPEATIEEIKPPESAQNAADNMRIEKDASDEPKDSDVMAVDDEQNKMVEEENFGPGEPTAMATEKDEIVDPMLDDDDDTGGEAKMDDADDEDEAMAIDEGEAMAVEEGDKVVEDVEMAPETESAPVLDEEMKDESGEPPSGHVENLMSTESSMNVEEEKPAESTPPPVTEDAAIQDATAPSAGGPEAATESQISDSRTTVPKPEPARDEQDERKLQETLPSQAEVPPAPGGVAEEAQEETETATNGNGAGDDAERLIVVPNKSLEPIPEEQPPPDEPSKAKPVDLTSASVADPASLSAKKQTSTEDNDDDSGAANEPAEELADSQVPPKSTRKRKKDDNSSGTPSVRTRRSTRSKQTTTDDAPLKTPKQSLPPRAPKPRAVKTTEKDADSVISSRSRRSNRSSAKKDTESVGSRTRSATKKEKATPAKVQHPKDDEDDVSVLSHGSADSTSEKKPRTRRSARRTESERDDDSTTTAPSKAGKSIRPRSLMKDAPAGDESIASRKSARSTTSSTGGSRTRRGRAGVPKTPESASTSQSKRQLRSTRKASEKDDEKEEVEEKKVSRRTTRSASKAATKEGDGDGDESSKKGKGKKPPPAPTRTLRPRK